MGRAGERQTRRGRKDKRDEENGERERERPVVVPWRAIYGTFHFFSSLFIPAPSLPTILPLSPPRPHTGCTRVRTLPPSSLLLSFARTCPFFCRISARFFGPRNTEWTMVVVVVDGDAGGDGQRLPHPSFLSCLSILPPLPLSSTILLPSKRRKERNAAELQRAQSRG